MQSDSEQIRVLHIYRTYFPDTQGGGQEVIRQVCHNTRPFGVESRVFTLSPRPSALPLERDEAVVYQARQHFELASCSISLSRMAQFRELARWADVLHYHFPWPYGDLLHLLNSRDTTKPAIITYHSDVVRQKLLYFFYRPLMQRFLARIDRIVTTSPNYARSSNLLRQQAQKVRVIPIGLNEAELATANPVLTAKFREQFGDDFFFFVGVFRYYKGLQFLLEAAKNSSANIVLAGSGPEDRVLRAFKKQHKLANIHFVGRVSDEEKMSYLTACRGFVFPSHLPSESFGISLLEAALSSKPMISCEIGTGTTYVNKHNETGLVVPPADPDALANAINTLAKDPAYAEQLGKQARSRFETLFTGAAMGKQYYELYRELLT